MGFCIYSQQCIVVCFQNEVFSLHIDIPSAESSHSLVAGIVSDCFPVETKLTQFACLPFFGHVNQIQENSKSRILKDT